MHFPEMALKSYPKTWVEISLVSSVNFGAAPLSCAIKAPQGGRSLAQPSLCDFSPFPAAAGSWLMVTPGHVSPAH